MEGYFWRLTDRAGGRVIIALCGINRAADGTWANVALAGHPGDVLAEAIVPEASADPDGLGVGAGDALGAGPAGLRVDLGPGARLDVAIHDPVGWPRRAFGGLGPAHAVPALSQYWHPHVLGGRVTGTAVLGGETLDLAGWDVYAEKNWGRGGFPRRWWWGQAQGFARRDVCVAFAGGEVAVAPGVPALTATALVVRVGADVVRLGQPLATPVRADVVPGAWRLAGRGPRWSVAVRAHAGAADTARALPVPLPAARRTVPGAHQHLAGTLEVVVRRRGRVAFAGTSTLAGLERGDLSTHPEGRTR